MPNRSSRLGKKKKRCRKWTEEEMLADADDERDRTLGRDIGLFLYLPRPPRKSPDDGSWLHGDRSLPPSQDPEGAEADSRARGQRLRASMVRIQKISRSTTLTRPRGPVAVLRRGFITVTVRCDWPRPASWWSLSCNEEALWWVVRPCCFEMPGALLDRDWRPGGNFCRRGETGL